MNEVQKESHRRSILKGITWRCIATLTTYLLALLWTGEAETAGKIAAAEFVIKFFIYYLHERLWQWKPSATEKLGKSTEELVNSKA